MDPYIYMTIFSPFSQVLAIERGLETTTSHRNEHKTQSLLQCLGVHVHGVQEHSKGGFLSLLTPLLPLLPTGLKTRRKSRHVGRLPFQLREAIQQVSRQIVAVLVGEWVPGPPVHARKPKAAKCRHACKRHQKKFIQRSSPWWACF